MKMLLVDDDDAVLRMTCRLLKTLGHNATPCESAQQALSIFDSHKDFELVVTDLNMPGMNGLELAQKIWALCPQIPVIYFSGEDEASVQLSGRGKESYLQKPFGRDDLHQAIESIMAC